MIKTYKRVEGNFILYALLVKAQEVEDFFLTKENPK